MVNIPKLKGKMVEKGFTQARLGKAIGVSLSTINQRFRQGGDVFTVGEVERIAMALQMSQQDVNEIFFNGLLN
jgi:hypothetical protein